MSYRDPIIAKVISILDAEGPSELRGRYSQGDPGILPPRSQLPLCFVSMDPEGEIKNITNAEDETNMKLTFNIVYNVSRDLGQAFDVTAGEGILDLMIGRNADYTLKTSSILAVLRKYQGLGNRLWIGLRDPIQIDGGMSFGKRGVEQYAREGIIRATVTHHQLRPV